MQDRAPTVMHPKFVATIQLGQLLGGLITAVPLIAGVAIGYARFTSLEDRVVVLVTDVHRLATETKKSADDTKTEFTSTKMEFGKLITESAGRQNVTAAELRALQRSDGQQDIRIDNLADSMREQRKSNADLATKIDGVRDAVSAIRIRLPGAALQK